MSDVLDWDTGLARLKRLRADLKAADNECIRLRAIYDAACRERSAIHAKIDETRRSMRPATAPALEDKNG